MGFKSSVGAGMGFGGIASSAHTLANKFRLVSSAIKTFSAAKKANRLQEESKVESSMSPESFESVLETLWNYTVVDVEATLRQVCFKLFKDSSISHEVRTKRAEGLILTAQIFMENAQDSSVGLSEIGSKFKQQA